jgi:hypothetical protein
MRAEEQRDSKGNFVTAARRAVDGHDTVPRVPGDHEARVRPIAER